MKNTIKIISTILIISILINLIPTILPVHKTYAVTQTISADINNINESKYPGIKERIKLLQSKYPNWKFKILYTGLDWNTVIANEYTGHGARPTNLVPNSANYKGAWVCPICKETPYDNGSWRCVSEQGIKYMMDPRNSINASDVFQFEELTNTGYDMNIIRTMTQGTYLAGHEQVIVNSSVNSNMNPYYIIARLLHEQSKSGTVAVFGNGYNGQYIGYYNAFNIAASGNTPAEIILNELAYAKKKGWTSLDASITGGINFLASQYVNYDQNTLYLQKFDVAAKGGLYCNQYMQNILAAQNEGTTIRDIYIDINTMAYSHTFIIPVYENMPQEPCARPNSNGSSTVETDLVKVNVETNLRIRNTPNGSTTVDLLYKNEIVTRLEKATSKVNGTYWDKVRKSNGSVGYAARETYTNETPYKLYLVPINTDSNGGTNGSGGTNNPPPNSSTSVKIDNVNNIITVVPGAIAFDILNSFGGAVKITLPDGRDLPLGGIQPMATGFIVQDKYTVVKKGDINGDGKVDTADLLAIQKQLLKIANIESGIRTKAADINNDSKIDTADLLAIQKKLLNICDISI
ncbi:MAG: hypothetical protein HFJ59_01695 [Clostridia bacterium]|nr:hypothetical protein [Clostridia bacterium]